MPTKKIAILAMIAGLYAGISLLLAPLSFANIQVRLAEALTLLPVIMPSSILALGLGCFVTNLLGVMSGANIAGMLDVFVGTATTIIAGYCSYRLRHYCVKGYPVLATLPPILLNAVVIGLELTVVLSPSSSFSWPFFSLIFMQIALGQFIAIFIIGLPLIKKLGTIKFFTTEKEDRK